MSSGKRYAILVGNGYFPQDEQRLPKLRCAENDVKAVERILAAKEIGDFHDVIVLPNKASNEVSRRINQSLKQVTKEDLVLIYYSGHGKCDAHGDLYLATVDTETAVLESTSLSAINMKKYIDLSLSNKVILMLDCCYSGAIGNAFIPKGDIEEQWKPLSKSRGTYILTATGITETALEKDGDDLSIFTKHIIQGLQEGEADTDTDGLVTMDDLYNYLYKKMPAETAQSPTRIYLGTQGESLWIAKAKKKLTKEQLNEWRTMINRLENKIPADIFTQAIQYTLLPLTGVMGKAEYFQLMEQLHTWHIDVNRFVEDWYGLEKTTGSDSTLPTPPSTGIVIPPVTIPALPKFDFKSVRLNAKGEIVEEFNGQASYLQENLDNGAVLEMVKLPGGSFKMGISEEEAEVARKEMQRYGVSAENARAWTENAKPQHEVKITGFYMGKYVVTQGQWRMVAGWPKVKMELKPDPSYFKGDDLPVEQVSWEEAEEFCERLSRKTGKRYRLPTEAEWEYACRAGRTTPYAFGETITPEIVNYNGNYPYGEAPKGEYRGKTTAMGSLGIANEFGLYDMHGNVWEWCSDWYGAYSSSKSSRIEQDASGTTSGSYRVMRGGGWYNSAVYCRSAYRGYDTPDHRDSDVGFRLVRTLE